MCTSAAPFLNGINVAWIDWGADFASADAHSASTYCGWEEALRFTVANGGNALRVWLFTNPESQLLWSADGRVSGLAPGVTLMTQTLLALASEYDCRVVLVLFNGADASSHEARALLSEERVLASLLAAAVRPLAAALRGFRSLAAVEIVNEPEGLIDLWASSAAAGADAECGRADGVSACAGRHDGPGWNRNTFPLVTVQRFVNRVAGAIKAVDGALPTTLGSWSACAAWAGAEAASHGARHLFSNACLVAAGGEAAGTIDVRQVHAYPKEASGTAFAPTAAVGHSAASLGLGAPVLLGEVSSRWDDAHASAAPTTTRRSMASLHAEAVSLGYAGIFGWSFTCDFRHDRGCVGRDELAAGLRAGAVALAARNGHDSGPSFPRPLPPPARVRNYRACECSDRDDRVGNYTCREQASFGKCGESWMGGCTAWCTNCGSPLESTMAPRPPPSPCAEGGAADAAAARMLPPPPPTLFAGLGRGAPPPLPPRAYALAIVSEPAQGTLGGGESLLLVVAAAGFSLGILAALSAGCRGAHGRDCRSRCASAGSPTRVTRFHR